MTAADDRKFKTFTRRASLISGGMLVLSSALVGRMYFLQVVGRSQYELLADENRISLRLLVPERGDILDRFGRAISINRTDYRIIMIPEQAEDMKATLAALGDIIPISEREYLKIVKASKRQRSFLPISVAENLDWESFARVNVNIPDLPGIQPDVGTTRLYPEKEYVAHLVGYVGAVSEKDLNGEPLLELPGFKIGKTGMERVLDKKLRGLAGNRKVEVNALGRVIRELSRQDSVAGESFSLTIDLDIQKFAAQRLKDQSGAVVVMDALNGEILALASTPSFDPNDFNFGISQTKWDGLNKDIRKPLTNKAVSGQYPPGSTFKMIVALAALEAGVIRPDEKIFCNGRYRLGNHNFFCWADSKGGHGAMDMVQAIAQSCDVYFYDISRRVGIDKIHDMAKRFGLGERFNIEIPNEARGLIPNERWKNINFDERWQGGETVIAGIGQGYVLATPLQLAVMTARLVNGGKAVKPRILMQEPENTLPEDISSDMLAEFPADIPEDINVSQKDLAIVLQGMSAVSNHRRGTAFGHRISDRKGAMGGKTGTSQVRRISTAERATGVRKNKSKQWIERDHALFVGYAPVKNPRFVVSVLIEHGGSGSRAAAPVARDILEYTVEQDKIRKDRADKKQDKV